ncbi:flagellin [Sinorhizobium meliloti]|uniref:Flagellin A n=6 Tax=Rhizobium meliloti TaxID=382 RepID=FLAA_RHIME|nr:flagellin [Sinorhizobium meliloti]Q03841.1 RecName: Full=Flagellin A [Sinorhizobium meliloti 1021]TWA89444.1 flagellin [Ensifer sp. SEMIA 134]TWB25561.1 flagellin [Ensifer sp. SEMIA 135]AAA26279.1 flagellin A [Sinorhizobium meliloti]AEG03220.1 flagellin domain protein [Sinorhizobium meliloti BL225C]AGA05628.1 Flagellin-related hook-associated protein [Sinorhizobium meliloti GR4]
MTSILTNNSAMAALSTLRSISSSMEDTQSRISSGLRVGSASDNAAYWSIATTMRSDNQALSAVQDALGLGAAKVDTAYSGMESAIEVVKEIKAKLVAATEDGVDKAKIQEEITQLKDQLTSIAEAASFSGENWLQADLSGGPVTKSVVGGFVRDSSGAVSVKKVDYSLNTDTVLFDTTGNTGILDKVYNVSQASVTLPVNVNGTTSEYTVGAYNVDDLIDASATFDGDYANVGAGALAGDYVKVQGSWVKAVDVAATGQEVVYDDGTTKWGVDTTVTGAPATNVAAPASIATIDITIAAQAGNLDALIAGVDEALTDMTSAAASLGSISSRIDLQSDFVNKLSDSIDSGVGRLVDADMNEESTRLKALQTQQQLAIQALSIANSDSQNVLSLFR